MAPLEDWLMDTIVTYHFIPSLDTLSSITPYQGTSLAIVGNRKMILIYHVGTKTLNSTLKPLFLHFALHTLHLIQNLVNAFKLCADNSIIF